jgi:hypothetical protein
MARASPKAARVLVTAFINVSWALLLQKFLARASI